MEQIANFPEEVSTSPSRKDREQEMQELERAIKSDSRRSNGSAVMSLVYGAGGIMSFTLAYGYESQTIHHNLNDVKIGIIGMLAIGVTTTGCIDSLKNHIKWENIMLRKREALAHKQYRFDLDYPIELEAPLIPSIEEQD